MINFLKINPKINFKNTNNKSDNLFFKGAFDTSNLAPLRCDTISFSGRRSRSKEEDIDIEVAKNVGGMQKRSSKNLRSKSDMGSLKVANDILREEDICFAYERFKTDISSIFGMEVIDFSDKKRGPMLHERYQRILRNNIKNNSPILSITARKKEAASIKEKMGSKQITTKKDAKHKITDILGMRITLSGTDKDAGNYVIGKLTKAVEQGKIKVVEIENFRNPEFKYPAKHQYASDAKLEGLMRAGLKRGVKNFHYNTKQTESGYTAIHLLLEFPGGIKGELQIAGLDVFRLKEIEDLCFKTLTNKALPYQYKPIEKMFTPIRNDDEKYYAFMDYTRRAYAAERAKDSHMPDDNLSFLELPEDIMIDSIYDFNNIEKIKKSIDEKTEQNKKMKLNLIALGD